MKVGKIRKRIKKLGFIVERRNDLISIKTSEGETVIEILSLGEGLVLINKEEEALGNKFHVEVKGGKLRVICWSYKDDGKIENVKILQALE